MGGIDHVDPVTGTAVQHIPLPFPSAVAVGGDAIWAVSSNGNKTGRLVRIDPRSDAIVGKAVATGRDPAAVAVGSGAVWVANRGDDSVWRVDPHTGAVRARIPVGDQPSALAVGNGGVWVVNSGDSTISRIDPSSNQLQGAPISLGKELRDLALTSRAVWVSAGDGTVTRLDPRTGQVVGSPLSPAHAPLNLAADAGSVWVGSVSDSTITQIVGGTK